MAKRQSRHSRVSKKGKPFYAGKGKKRIKPKYPVKMKREIIKEYQGEIQQDLKRAGRSRIPDIGVLRINIKKATKSRWGVNPFTKERMRFKAKPKRKVVKFHASKALKKYI